MKRYYSICLNDKVSMWKNNIFNYAKWYFYWPKLFSLYDTNNDEIEYDKSNHKKWVSTKNKTYLYFGYINLNMIQRLVKDRHLNLLEAIHSPIYESYLESKMTKRSFNKKDLRVRECLKIVHIIFCRPLRNQAQWGFEYIIMNDYSKFCYVYLMILLSEIFRKV